MSYSDLAKELCPKRYRERLLEQLLEHCGQCGKELGQAIYSDAICPSGRFCSRECLDDRLAGK